jgi:methionyl aminopeptidase
MMVTPGSAVRHRLIPDMGGTRMVLRKTHHEILHMAAAGRMLAAVHEVLRAAVRAGITTADLDELAETEIRARGGLPSFKGYRGYPATLNTSVNHQIVHAIPSDRVWLRDGDVLTVDCGVLLDGYHADAACTWVVGGDEQAPPAVRRLITDTYEALWRGIARLRVGDRLGDVSAAIGDFGIERGYGVIADHDGRSIGGHGIGRRLHEDPFVANRGRRGRGLRLKPGLVFAIEPMFTLGSAAWRVLDDDWTTVTGDGAIAAHWEHTVAVTDRGPWVLSARAEEAARLELPAVVGR